MRKEEEQVFSNESQMTKILKKKVLKNLQLLLGDFHLKEEHATLMKPHEECS